ncbi:hypothetical protein [Glycomyces buryatensis]|uniref:Secreted protein n=1 Tax=Glycomyces buryatensis TaxID=2570927 RepID=A0A4V4HSE3_9ACTN|nr:hypothetical protein [Glycomyces buryatensis]THV41286.1 hypothetical protein FAB82_12015 [Glycomyces buryatensis]
MRYRNIVAVAAAAAAASVIPGGTASASTPDWLTLANVETGQPSLLPEVCGAGPTGSLSDPVCEGLLGTDSEDAAETFGESIPEAPAGYSSPSVANLDLRNFAKWQVCGVAVASTAEDFDCDNSITGEAEPVEPAGGVSLVNADTTGAFNWSVCGISAFQAAPATDC